MDASGCPDPHHRCHSGKYTLLLDVTDTLGNHYYDTQHVWFDNKPMVYDKYVVFEGIEGLPSCTDLHLGPETKLIPPGAPCGVPWPVALLGIAYDEYIDETDLAYPSDNFDFYNLSITRQGGPTYIVPITPSLAPPVFGPDPLRGTSRVGDPGERCEPLPTISGCPVPPPIPPKVFGTLTTLDLRAFDEVCAPSLVAPFAPPAGFALEARHVLRLHLPALREGQDRELFARALPPAVVAALGGLHLQRPRGAALIHEPLPPQGGDPDRLLW